MLFPVLTFFVVQHDTIVPETTAIIRNLIALAIVKIL